MTQRRWRKKLILLAAAVASAAVALLAAWAVGRRWAQDDMQRLVENCSTDPIVVQPRGQPERRLPYPGLNAASGWTREYTNIEYERHLRGWRWFVSDREIARFFLDEFYAHPYSRRAHVCYMKLLQLDALRKDVDDIRDLNVPQFCADEKLGDFSGFDILGWHVDRRHASYEYWGLEQPAPGAAGESRP